MKTKTVLGWIALATLLAWTARAQIYDTNGDYVQTFAGSGFSGYLDGVGQQTMFYFPSAVAADSHGILFVLDTANSRIRIITPSGTVSTFAGGGAQSTGVGTNVDLSSVNDASYAGMAIDSNDTIWLVASSSGHFYKITSDAQVTFTNLPLSGPSGLCADSSGNIYVSSVNRIYRYDTNAALTVFAGSGNRGYADGTGIFTAFTSPTAMAVDAANDIYVWDSGNDLIRKIDQSQKVTTVAGKKGFIYDADGFGTNAAFGLVGGLCSDSRGNIIVTCGSSVREVSVTGDVTTLAGNFLQTGSGYANGIGSAAEFWGPTGVCLSRGAIFVADTYNQRIRCITNNPTPQIVGASNLQLATYPGLQIMGAVGRAYQIQSSPDMTAWKTRATVILSASPFLWIDPSPVASNKFYRALLLP